MINTDKENNLKFGYKIISGLLIFSFVFIFSFSFIHSPGTDDINFWLKWIKNASNYGLVHAYKINNDMYPPLSSAILYFTNLISSFTNIDIIVSLKLSLFIFLLTSALIFFLWTKDLLFTALAMLSFNLNTILSYLDIYMLPTFIISFWALNKKKYVLFSVLFTLTCLIKMQPIIIAPFLIIYLLDFRNVNDLKRFDWKEFIKKLVFPSILIISLTFTVYGLEIVTAFSNATNDNMLSGDALNLNWIMTYFLRAFHYFGPLKQGYINWIITEDLRIVILPKILFFGFYLVTIFSFMKEEKTFKNLLLFSIIGHLSYFIFNTGVHENHLVISSVLSLILFIIDRKYLPLAISIITADNLNMFLFYGINGKGFPFNRVIGVDITLIFAVIYLSAFLYFFYLTVIPVLKNKCRIIFRVYLFLV
jgi:hypothetical protein